MEEETFHGWDLSPESMFKSKENILVTSRLVNEVKSLNLKFETVQINDAAYRFFRTKKDAEKCQSKGTDEKMKTNKRHHERIVRKRKDRESAIRKSTKLSQEQKDKWLKIVCNNEFMSSEESEEDDIVIHSVPWRAKLVNSMFQKIDQRISHSRSSRSRCQKKSRKVGRPSTRPCPSDDTIPSWAIEQ